MPYTSNVETLSAILQSNWTSAGNGLIVSDIEWDTSQIDIKKWVENKTSLRNIVTAYNTSAESPRQRLRNRHPQPNLQHSTLRVFEN